MIKVGSCVYVKDIAFIVTALLGDNKLAVAQGINEERVVDIREVVHYARD